VLSSSGCVPLEAFILCAPEHLSSNPLPSCRRINIHAAQLERVSRGAFQTECADHRVASDGHPEAAIPFAVVGRDTINFFLESAIYVRLECVVEIGWAQKPVDRNEEFSVPFLTSATDRMDGRWLYLCSALLGSAANFALAAFGHGFVVAAALRFLGGIGLAGIHTPGLNMLMDRVEHYNQGRAAGIYTSSYAAASAGSFLIAGVVDQAFGRRATFIVAGIGPVLSISVLPLLPAPLVNRKSNQRQPPFRALLHNRSLLAYVSRRSPEIPGRFSRYVSGSSLISPGSFAFPPITSFCRRSGWSPAWPLWRAFRRAW
jgi:Major Facilitator Superfamily